jgi:uncharacterized membrane protein YeaQ/YmgE (transglycosylase-associated protein family)
MGLIGALIFGFLAGVAAKLLMPGNDPGGCITTSILGMVGAVVGKSISRLLGGPGDITRWTWHGFGLSVLGAVVVLIIWRALLRRKR